MTVHPAHPVGAHRIEQLAAQQVRLGCLAGTRGAGGGGDGDVLAGDQSVSQCRQQGKGDVGRVAARYRDLLGRRELGALAGQFRQAVGPGSGMLAAVELRPLRGIDEPEVGSAVDHQRVGAQLGGDRRGCAVRQRKEDDVVPGQVVGGGVEHLAVGQLWQIRQVLTELRTRIGVRRQVSDGQLGVRSSETQDLAARITGAACHRYRIRHAHNYAVEVIDMQLLPVRSSAGARLRGCEVR